MKTGKARKILRNAVVALVLVIAALVVAVSLLGGPIIKSAVNTAGPTLLGVDVTLQDVSFSPFKGKLALKGLHVGNPEGFKTPGIIDIGLLDVDLDETSLFKKVMVITDVRIEAPEITFEKSLKTSNLGRLMEQLSGKDETKAQAVKDEPGESAKPAGDEKGRKVVIRKLTISGAQVNMSMTLMGGKAVPLPLPTIAMSNIGGEGDKAEGVSFAEAIRDIFAEIFKGVSDTAAGAGKLAVGGAQTVGEGVTDGAQAVGESLGKAADTVTGLFKRNEKPESEKP